MPIKSSESMIPEKEWVLPTSPVNMNDWVLPDGILPSALQQILFQRGITDAKSANTFLSPDHYEPASPFELPNMDIAIDILNKLIEKEQGRVLIWGDFDADGQTSTSILLEGLRGFGLEVEFYIPDRLRESHGVHLEPLRNLLNQYQPDLLLVCDTGTSDIEAIAFAKSTNIPIIIADHHELGEELPPADALVNPLLIGNPSHPLRTLSGVGVSFLLLQALYEDHGRGEELYRFLDLVAIGLMADVVELVNDTRFLVQLGMEQLRQTERVGLIALCQNLRLNPEYITSRDIGFKIAPVLNAFGRLDTAEKGVELLTTADMVNAQMLSANAITLNKQRRNLTDQTYAAAQAMIENDTTLLDWEALVLSSPNWHGGIVGIVAARLAETYHCPVALLVTDEDGNARGSLRSIEGYHVGNALAQLDDILTKYGGHAGAGGLSVDANNLPLVRRRLSQAFEATRESVPTPMVNIDVVMTLPELSLDFAHQLQRLEPFGAGNPEPIFASQDLSLSSVAKVDKKGRHRRLTVQDLESNRQTIFWWGSADSPLPEGRFDIAYTIEVSTYRDEQSLQLSLVDWQQREAPPADPIETAELVDFRDQSSYPNILEVIQHQAPTAVIWAEGYAKSESPGVPFSQLSPSDTLVVYSIPPSLDRLKDAIEAVKPVQVFILAKPSAIQSLQHFYETLQRLLVAIVKQQNGETTLSQLSERLATTETLMRLGLEILASTGVIEVSISLRGNVTVKQGNISRQNSPDEALAAKLKRQWEEFEAYHRYFRRATLDQLLE